MPCGWTSTAFLNATFPEAPPQPPCKGRWGDSGPFSVPPRAARQRQGQGACCIVAFAAGRWLNDGTAQGPRGSELQCPRRRKGACPTTGQALARLGCSQVLHWPHAMERRGVQGSGLGRVGRPPTLSTCCARGPGGLTGCRQGTRKGQCAALTPAQEGGTWGWRGPGGRKDVKECGAMAGRWDSGSLAIL